MEKAKTTFTNEERPIVKQDWNPGSCAFWIFGNEESCKNDLKEKFVIKENK
ncbi:hypothetical protein [uncultured Coprobacter sp.]|uniref:hypothetical protein n=1 Tax=uncultured Coprobacter sp. TaxID=1720550 RepID=UPI0026277EE8|nr:hypothetical protein [uncultured Coprobacter sp.]